MSPSSTCLGPSPPQLLRVVHAGEAPPPIAPPPQYIPAMRRAFALEARFWARGSGSRVQTNPRPREMLDLLLVEVRRHPSDEPETAGDSSICHGFRLEVTKPSLGFPPFLRN
eukprot:5421448-Prymnesium_polylepis.2